MTNIFVRKTKFLLFLPKYITHPILYVAVDDEAGQTSPADSLTFILFHRLNHRLDELDFLIRQVVLCVEVCIRSRTS